MFLRNIEPAEDDLLSVSPAPKQDGLFFINIEPMENDINWHGDKPRLNAVFGRFNDKGHMVALSYPARGTVMGAFNIPEKARRHAIEAIGDYYGDLEDPKMPKLEASF